MPDFRLALIGAATTLATTGCVARTVASVVTAPVRIASSAADLATTSQSEADEKRGRELRRREERLGRLERDWAREARRCENGKVEACEKRDTLRAEIDALLPSVPVEPR